MPAALIPILLSALSGVASGLFGILIKAFTDKLAMKLLLQLADKVVKSTKTDMDDNLFAPIKEAIEKEMAKS